MEYTAIRLLNVAEDGLRRLIEGGFNCLYDLCRILIIQASKHHIIHNYPIGIKKLNEALAVCQKNDWHELMIESFSLKALF